jgi:hypothetical protein
LYVTASSAQAISLNLTGLLITNFDTTALKLSKLHTVTVDRVTLLSNVAVRGHPFFQTYDSNSVTFSNVLVEGNLGESFMFIQLIMSLSQDVPSTTIHATILTVSLASKMVTI